VLHTISFIHFTVRLKADTTIEFTAA